MDSIGALTWNGLMGLGGAFAFVLFAATVIEIVIEHTIALLYDNIQALQSYKWTQKLWAGGVGILSAFVFEINLMAMVAKHLEFALPETESAVRLAFVITGLVLGMGAQRIHEKWFKK